MAAGQQRGWACWAVVVASLVVTVSAEPNMTVNDGNLMINLDAGATMEVQIGSDSACRIDSLCEDLQLETTTRQSSPNALTQALFTRLKPRANEEALENRITNLINTTVYPELARLQANKADGAALEALEHRVKEVNDTKGNAADITALETQLADLISQTINPGLADLQASKANVTDLEALELSLQLLNVTKSNAADVDALSHFLAQVHACLTQVPPSAYDPITDRCVDEGFLEANITALAANVAHLMNQEAQAGTHAAKLEACLNSSRPGRYNPTTDSCEPLVLDACPPSACPAPSRCRLQAIGYSCDCPPSTYRAENGTCFDCASGTTTHEWNLASCPLNLHKWTYFSTTLHFDALKEEYDDLHYEYGCSYNGFTSCHWTSPNEGATMLMAHPFYPQGDTRTTLVWGTTTINQGLYFSEAQGNRWTHFYYQLDDNGNPNYLGSNGIREDVRVHHRPLYTPWERVGRFQDFDTIAAQYPQEEYWWGTRITGQIQYLGYSKWNTPSEALTAYPFRMYSGDPNNVQYVADVFTRNSRDGGDSGDGWNHRIYQLPNQQLYEAGEVAEHFPFYVRKRQNSWVTDDEFTTMADFANLANKYPITEYEIGVVANGATRLSIFTGWNLGQRVTTYPFHLQGDNADEMWLGTSVMSYNVPLSSGTIPNYWYHTYYAVGGGNDVVKTSNGDVSTRPIRVRKRTAPWVQIGTLADLFTLSASYPQAEYDYGLAYNDHVLPITLNGWNLGTRAAVYPMYPIYDDATEYEFGAAVFTYNLANEVDNNWRHSYYTFPRTFVGSNNNAGLTPLYVRPTQFDELVYASLV
ncbi:uncharacterized protein MONBRDRAFT_29471 [Monosiga brevicollis MX1]|uniref:EGF-like domain-containing protein n=1 Tax=Monosiga brevicollis TaxID=81824 RepID=A9VB69_MONBE|nr:uncharacterized protein MONBRDRAFT_29471 [Monosiga brevicollis MX1]EDQ85135.1 predicted protein [Monosiga brevicollis MX1]|eukprot:XP_001749960.1 hypothetical protein [Monosiga brevicollis MX1]